MTTGKTNHRSLPRKKRLPTARDQEIFLAYRTVGRASGRPLTHTNPKRQRGTPVPTGRT